LESFASNFLRQRASENDQIADPHQRLKILSRDVNVGRIVVFEIHRDDVAASSEKGWHLILDHSRGRIWQNLPEFNGKYGDICRNKWRQASL
jgi:hypothetical protein